MKQRLENESVLSDRLEDDFICSEIKRPFRTLFPDEESDNGEESHFPNIM